MKTLQSQVFEVIFSKIFLNIFQKNKRRVLVLVSCLIKNPQIAHPLRGNQKFGVKC
jgi:hypothetical protein